MEVTSIDLTAKELGYLVKALDVVATAHLLADNGDGQGLVLRFADALAYMYDAYPDGALESEPWME